jgi:Putative lumazine-binding
MIAFMASQNHSEATMTAAKPIDRAADLAAIEAVIQSYLDGLYEGDVDKLAAAFHPTSALAQSTLNEAGNGTLQVTPRDAWLAAVRARPSPKSQGLARGDEILAIDLAGPTWPSSNSAAKSHRAISPTSSRS